MLRVEDCILIAETFEAAVNVPLRLSSVNPTRRLVRSIILTHSGRISILIMGLEKKKLICPKRRTSVDPDRGRTMKWRCRQQLIVGSMVAFKRT